MPRTEPRDRCPRGHLLAAGGAAAWLVVELARGGFPATAAFFLSLAALWSLRRRAGGRTVAEPTPAMVFCATLAVYLSTFRWHGGDDMVLSLLPVAVLKHGTLALDALLQPFLMPEPELWTVKWHGRHLSVYPIAPGVLALPLYLIPAASGAAFGEQFLHQLSKLAGALMTAGSAALFYAAARRRSSKEWALMLTAAYAFGSWAMSVSSQALWQHSLAVLGLSLGLWGMTRERDGDAWAGLGFGLAAAARPDHVFVLAAAGLALLRTPRRIPSFLVGCTAALLPLAVYWWIYTGRLLPPEMGYQSKFLSHPRLEALAGLLLSPHRGLLPFFPLAPFAIWAVWRSRDLFSALLLGSQAVKLLLIASYANWVAGWSFGCRYFSSMSLILLFFCAPAEAEVRRSPRLRAVWSAAAAWGILTHLSGGYFKWPGHWALERTMADIWNPAVHPAANLFASAGGLGGLPAPLRWLAACGLAAAAAMLAVRMERALRPAGHDESGRAERQG